MKNIKRIISLLLVFSVIFSASAFAATFSDLDGHWSESYIMDLYNRGYMNGYENGTMRPDNEITGAEALVMLSRVFEADDITMELAINDYGDYADDIIPSGSSWLNNENAVVLCLAGGVITETELEALINKGGLTGSIEKEYLAVLFARAMQLEDETRELIGVSLGFYDKSNITSAYVPYIYLLTEAGIITGTDENMFEPHSSVTRAVVSAMLSRTLAYLEEGEGLPTLEGYSNTSKVEGVIKSATASSVVLCTSDGVIYEFSLASRAEVTVDGTAKALSSAYLSNWITVYYDKTTGKVNVAAVDTADKWVQGILKSRTTSSARKVTLTDASTGTDTTYSVNTSAVTYYNDGKIDYASLAAGNFVTAAYGSNLTAIYAYSGSHDLSGTITRISYGSVTTVSVYAGEGLTFQLLLNFSNPPTITKGDVEYTNGVNKLTAGNTIDVTIVKGEITLIAVEEQEANVFGTVTAISYTSAGTLITVTDTYGTESSYTISTAVTIIKNGVEVTLGDLNVGDGVAMVVNDSVVSEITITQSSATAGTLTGTVAAIGTSKEIYVISESSLPITVDVSGATITKNTGSIISSYKNIPVGSTVYIYGKYTSTTEFTATLVTVIE